MGSSILGRRDTALYAHGGGSFFFPEDDAVSRRCPRTISPEASTVWTSRLAGAQVALAPAGASDDDQGRTARSR